MENLTLGLDACNAHLLRGVIEATTPPDETLADARLRAGSIIEMFSDFDPRGAMAAMIACHCIALRFVTTAALRDVSALRADTDPKVQARMRATATGMSKSLHMWVDQYKSIDARDEARATGYAAAHGAAKPPAPRAASPDQTSINLTKTPLAAAPPQSPAARPVPPESIPPRRSAPPEPMAVEKPASCSAAVAPVQDAHLPPLAAAWTGGAAVSLRGAMLASTTLSTGGARSQASPPGA